MRVPFAPVSVEGVSRSIVTTKSITIQKICTRYKLWDVSWQQWRISFCYGRWGCQLRLLDAEGDLACYWWRFRAASQPSCMLLVMASSGLLVMSSISGTCQTKVIVTCQGWLVSKLWIDCYLESQAWPLLLWCSGAFSLQRGGESSPQLKVHSFLAWKMTNTSNRDYSKRNQKKKKVNRETKATCNILGEISCPIMDGNIVVRIPLISCLQYLIIALQFISETNLSMPTEIIS